MLEGNLNKKFSFQQDDAAGGIEVDITDKSSGDNYNNLWMAGWKFCYVNTYSGGGNTKISRVGLMRNAKNVYDDRKKYGWDECSVNINQGKTMQQGPYLYLCWATITIIE